MIGERKLSWHSTSILKITDSPPTTQFKGRPCISRSCTLEILNANGCIVDEMNLDSAIPMNWKEAVPEDEITKFKEETGNEYGVQIDSIPEFKPRKKFVRKDG